MSSNPDAVRWLQRIGGLILVCIALVAAVYVRNGGMATSSAAPAEPENTARIKYVWATPTPTPSYSTKIELGYGEHILWTNLKDQSAREIWVNQPLAGNPPEVTFAPFGDNAGGVILIMSPSGDPMVWTAAPNLDEQLWFGIIKVILFPDHVRIESTDGAFAIAPAMPTPITIIQQVEVPVPVYIKAEPAWQPPRDPVGPEVATPLPVEDPVDMQVIIEPQPGGCGSLHGGVSPGCGGPVGGPPVHNEPGQQFSGQPVIESSTHIHVDPRHDRPGAAPEHNEP